MWNCNNCNRAIPLTSKHAGKRVTCPFCEARQTVGEATDIRIGAATSQTVSVGGVGTELTAIFKDVDAKHTASCGCQAKAAEMDRVGIEDVKANRKKYIEWMREAYYSL